HGVYGSPASICFNSSRRRSWAAEKSRAPHSATDVRRFNQDHHLDPVRQPSISRRFGPVLIVEASDYAVRLESLEGFLNPLSETTGEAFIHREMNSFQQAPGS